MVFLPLLWENNRTFGHVRLDRPVCLDFGVRKKGIVKLQVVIRVLKGLEVGDVDARPFLLGDSPFLAPILAVGLADDARANGLVWVDKVRVVELWCQLEFWLDDQGGLQRRNGAGLSRLFESYRILRGPNVCSVAFSLRRRLEASLGSLSESLWFLEHAQRAGISIVVAEEPFL